MTLISTPIRGEFVHGAVDLEPTPAGLIPHRLISASRAQLGGPVEPKVFSDAAGVRIRLRSTARQIQLITRRLEPGPPDPLGTAPVYDLWCGEQCREQREAEPFSDVEGVTSDSLAPQQETQLRILRLCDLEHGTKNLEIWLPHQERVELLEIRSDAPIEPWPPAPEALHWVHHGSSISHGFNAVGASHSWPAVAARIASTALKPVELTNVGFAGNAKVDPFTARTLAATPAGLISVKLGINVVNGDSHTLRSFTPALHGFLDLIRENQHAQTPLVVITPLWCGIHEQTPGPVEAYEEPFNGVMRRMFRATGSSNPPGQERMTLEMLRAEMERVVKLRAASDPHLHLVNGLDLYGPDDAARLPLPDHLHPDTAAHQLIGERFAQHVTTYGWLV